MNPDIALCYFNSIILKAQNVAYSANRLLKSNKDNKFSIILRSSLAILKDLNHILFDFYISDGENINQTLTAASNNEDILDKLISTLPHNTLLKSNNIDTIFDNDRLILETTPCYGRKFEVLLSIITSIRSLEKTFYFQKQLWIQKNTLSKSFKCSIDQFA